jgi:hypothetical protein
MPSNFPCSDEQIAAVFGAMAAAPQHTFQVLTKRIERARAWFEWVQRREQHGRSLFPHDSPGWRIRQMLTAPVPPICPRRPPLCIVEDMPVPKKKPDAPPAQEPKGRGRPPKASEPAGEPKSAPIWQDYMSQVTATEPNEQFAKPSGIKQATLDADTGKLPNAGTKKQRTDIFAAWYKPVPAPASASGKINKLDGKLATECTPADALQDVTANAITAEIPSTDISYPRWQPPVAALASSLGLASGAGIPTEKSTMHNCSDVKPTVTISVTPSSGANFIVSSIVTSGTNPATKLVYYANDQELTSQQIGGSGVFPLAIKPGIEGPIKIQVKVVDSVLYTGSSNVETVIGTAATVGLNSYQGQPAAVVATVSDRVNRFLRSLQ